MQIFHKIKLIRTFFGYSQQQFAEIFFAKQRTLGDWEKNKSEPSFSFISSFATKFSLNPAWVLFSNETNIFTHKMDMSSAKKMFELKIEMLQKEEPHHIEVLYDIISSCYRSLSVDAIVAGLESHNVEFDTLVFDIFTTISEEEEDYILKNYMDVFSFITFLCKKRVILLKQ